MIDRSKKPPRLPAVNGPEEYKMSNIVIWCWILIAPFVGMIILNFKK